MPPRKHVINPYTGYKILVDGPTFKKLVREGRLTSTGKIPSKQKSPKKKVNVKRVSPIKTRTPTGTPTSPRKRPLKSQNPMDPYVFANIIDNLDPEDIKNMCNTDASFRRLCHSKNMQMSFFERAKTLYPKLKFDKTKDQLQVFADTVKKTSIRIRIHVGTKSLLDEIVKRSKIKFEVSKKTYGGYIIKFSLPKRYEVTIRKLSKTYLASNVKDEINKMLFGAYYLRITIGKKQFIYDIWSLVNLRTKYYAGKVSFLQVQ